MLLKRLKWSWPVLFCSLLAGNGYAPPDHDSFDGLLARYVADGVRYEEWAASEADRTALGTYVEQLQSLDPDKLDREDQLAYWINLYNAVTLRLILDHYPVKSIRDLAGEFESPWKRPLVEVNGKSISLDAIEHQIIRPRFDEPRIHFALNCAAKSCPPLAAFAFEGEQLEAQLETVTSATMHDPTFVQIDCETNRTIWLTPLFQWYETDWKESGVRGFLAKYLPDQEKAITDPDCAFSYREYDWTLNESMTEE